MRLTEIAETVVYRVIDMMTGCTSQAAVTFTNDGEYTRNNLTGLVLPQCREDFRRAVRVARDDTGAALLLGTEASDSEPWQVGLTEPRALTPVADSATPRTRMAHEQQ